MPIVIDYKLTGVESLTRTQVINAMKRALRGIGEYWFDAFLWKRFTPLGHTEYGFRKRSRKYDRFKRKHAVDGDGVPLVFTGEGRTLATSESTRARIHVTRHSVTIPLPRKFNRYNPKGPNMSEEVRHVSPAELRVLADNLVLLADAELANEVPAHLRIPGALKPQVKSLRLRNTQRQRRIGSPLNIRRRAA